MKFKPRCLPTAIGSVPHIAPSEACRVVLRYLKEIPAWPQLPKRSYLENMYVQYTEGMPRVVINLEKERVYFDTSGDISGDVTKFYESYLAEELDAFAVSPEYAAGLHAFLVSLQKIPSSPLFVKGQITGPISFGLTVPDEGQKPILYHEIFADVIVKALALKARWQERKFKKILPDVPTVVFFDEPYLTSYGSAFFSLNRGDVVKHLSEVFSLVDGLVGVHCCGRTDWTLFTESGANIISFDAYDYAESIALYPREIDQFLKGGGVLAWGIVPSTFPDPSRVEKENAESLIARLEEKMQLLVDKGIDKEVLLENCLITPNCGTASMSIELAERAYELTRAVSDGMKKKYFGR